MLNFPLFKKYLYSRVTNYYNDELKIFLVQCLRQIPYLKDMSEQILTHIAFRMRCDYKEPGTILFNMDQDFNEMILNEMIIVYDGVVNAYVTIDGKTKLIMDYLSKGTIFRANHFLSGRRHAFNVGVENNMVYYLLKSETLKELGGQYPELRNSCR